MEMESTTGGLSAFGFTFDPFEHLDSTKDAHLREYLIIPNAAGIALSDQPIALFAQPGGGKSALRLYTAAFYRDSRGVRFPITYIPDSFSMDPAHHFDGIRRSLARSVFMYLVSYPELFFTFTTEVRRSIKQLLLALPYGLEFIADGLMAGQFTSDLEQLLDESALSSLERLDQPHRQMAQELIDVTSLSHPMSLEECFQLLSEAFGAKSIHILVDSLDGFIETRSSQALIAWIEPLLGVLKQWDQHETYLKFFLPINISEVPALIDLPGLRSAALEWNDELLTELIRRRVYVASDGKFDSLDAISAPDVRNAELTLVRQLGETEKLPRHIIMRSKNLLHRVIAYNKEQITWADLVSVGKSAHDTSL
jgi:hypothetical protein